MNKFDMDTIHAQLKVERGKTVAVEIPTDAEIERIAMRMHRCWQVLPRDDSRL